MEINPVQEGVEAYAENHDLEIIFPVEKFHSYDLEKSNKKELADQMNKENNLDIIKEYTNEEQIDNRSIRVILEERLKQADALKKEIAAMLDK